MLPWWGCSTAQTNPEKFEQQTRKKREQRRSMAATLALLVLTATLAFSASRAASPPAWPSPAVSWWYVPDENWPQMIEQIAPHTNVVTSIMLQCGPWINDDGTITTDITSYCLDDQGNGTIPSLIALGVRVELWLAGGNSNLSAYRLLWNNPTTSIAQLVAIAKATNASGWNIDIEPVVKPSALQPSPPQVDVADAELYALWLNQLRYALHEIGVRLTIDVQDWSPAISEFDILAPVVDRMFDMDTYNADSMLIWLANYYVIVNSEIPRSAVGVGLGCWVDADTNNTWSVTAASATERVAKAQSDGVVEIGMFRLLPQTGGIPSSWPEQFWWDALNPFTAP
jgi:hypothetical protein